LERSTHFNLAGPMNAPELTPEGRRWLEQPPEGVAVDQCAEFWQVDWVREHYVVQALRALHVLMRDQNYVVVDGKVVIVDEFTGRLLPDRTWEQGLHQLVEVKEGCAISGQNMTLARLTYQNFFARYLRLAGMSGTLREVSAELASVYHVRTVRVEPFRPSQRFVDRTVLVSSKGEKEREVAAEVRRRMDRGQAVLVGTRSVRASEDISAALTAAGIAHRVLNALQNAAEAELVAMAGQPGAVTVATNMAGRGTDIPVARPVIERGGLHVILTEWHESARIDRQLFGRCARQGDPGSCRAIVAIDDDVIQTHGALAHWLLAHFSSVRMPGWAIWLLRRLVQTAAAASNAAQRRSTLLHDRQKRKQLAFSGRAE
jgi:preprotein translocase subunit SecA